MVTKFLLPAAVVLLGLAGCADRMMPTADATHSTAPAAASQAPQSANSLPAGAAVAAPIASDTGVVKTTATPKP